ncbi:hypothetical protein CEXT_289581 [Caerostris extrusa]|uniref:Uncharacterized protein n=1 Tax=Caerostris extrusa TaxID=172846 RepID=A0AAV4N0D2_CAEEX|nr:hypothetical protein CEXT_289581 [Caerostris extrusa]
MDRKIRDIHSDVALSKQVKDVQDESAPESGHCWTSREDHSVKGIRKSFRSTRSEIPLHSEDSIIQQE